MESRLDIKALNVATAIANDHKVATVRQHNACGLVLEVGAVAVLELFRNQAVLAHTVLAKRPGCRLNNARMDGSDIIPLLFASRIRCELQYGWHSKLIVLKAICKEELPIKNILKRAIKAKTLTLLLCGFWIVGSPAHALVQRFGNGGEDSHGAVLARRENGYARAAVVANTKRRLCVSLADPQLSGTTIWHIENKHPH